MIGAYAGIEIDGAVSAIEGGEGDPACKIILDKAVITAAVLKRRWCNIALIVHHYAVSADINALNMTALSGKLEELVAREATVDIAGDAVRGAGQARVIEGIVVLVEGASRTGAVVGEVAGGTLGAYRS